MEPDPSEMVDVEDPVLLLPEWTEVVWYVAHARPRAEKKVAAFCLEQGFEHRLPLYPSVKTYARKRVVFDKPLFPGYLFARVQRRHRLTLVSADQTLGRCAQALGLPIQLIG